MGKRRAKRKAPTRTKVVLDREFNCPFCNHEKSIDIKLDRPNKVATLTCRTCGVGWQTKITSLDENTDVYHKWIDSIEEINRDVAPEGVAGGAGRYAPARNARAVADDGRSDEEADD
ncbi:Elf1-domain-containing protein [Gonapodya prolifera JEL478]|uniref:Transcription elongation factor 1 homolog n=1 Tax=Gonapodya prolifera (strain JEL478) TaxID=1344416 RepID=A0A139AQN1_GONPJ|nr:Elf1-domain-containing protein [Gonapodya prolifera JEL478]|eukprot:KXS18813.1 Elf1-domain-containing protein [Gonapodya prolifera JEL478]